MPKSGRNLFARAGVWLWKTAKTGVFNILDNLISIFIPDAYQTPLRRRVNRLNLLEDRFSGLPRDEVFNSIYDIGAWGNSAVNRRNFSGMGSHDPVIVDGYVAGIKRFFDGLPNKPSVVDLGCGDFNVGSRILPFTSSYIACDLVVDVIAENEELFADDKLEFRVLDLVNDPIPHAEVIMVRQVLQHLPNADIHKFINKIRGCCRYLILTEHVSYGSKFKPNLDKPLGPGTRIEIGSGLVLTKPPFDFVAAEEQLLCEFDQHHGLVRTIVYTL